MDFLLIILRKNILNKLNIIYDLNNINSNSNSSYLYLTKKASELFRQFESRLFIIGDFIPDNDDINNNNLDENYLFKVIRKTGGFYYLILFDDKNNTIRVCNSLFSIMPVYYYVTDKNIYISSRVDYIAKINKINRLNKRFTLENLLFNYQLFNQSYIENVKLLPSNCYLKIKDSRLSIIKHTNIEEFFHENYDDKTKLDELVDLFIDRLKIYLPDNSYYQALTGGFDGRSLTAGGLFLNHRFSTYSFGNKNSEDVFIAQKLSEMAKIPFKAILLDEQYIEKDSLQNGMEFIENAEGNASFSRAHYLYATKILSKDCKYIITGNFGSEIFRALHVAGVVVGPNLYNLFSSRSFDEAVEKINNAKVLQYINRNFFKDEIEAIYQDLKSLPVFNGNYKSFDLNKKFYVFVFEELFRKYFGAEIKNQFYHLVNRCPFLDFVFIQELFKSKYAGIHSRFFEHNPVKRFKGQMFYSHFIERTFPPFLNIKLDKGYKPADLLTHAGKINLIKNYYSKHLYKILHNHTNNEDPYSVYQAFDYNRSYWEKLEIDGSLFNKKLVLDRTVNHQYDSYYIVLSQIYWLNKIKEIL